MQAVAYTREAHLGRPIDCCVMVRESFERLFGESTIEAVPVWRWHLWADRGAGPWEPVRAAEDAGILDWAWYPSEGQRHPPPPPRLRWCCAQGWRGDPLAPGVSGHTLFLRMLTPGTAIVLDSTASRAPDGRFEAWPDLLREFRGGLAIGLLKVGGANHGG